jgi:type IX secretion system PorP/SprF family membrane protein
VPTLLILFWTSHELFSQTSTAYSQYSFNSFQVNPAVAGSEGYTIIGLSAREQWIGIKDAPRVHNINYQARLFKKSFKPTQRGIRRTIAQLFRKGKVGLGANLTNDHAGIFDRTSMAFTYAFHIVRSRTQFSFGLSAGVSHQYINFSKVQLADPYENYIKENSGIGYTTDFTAGFYYSTKEYFAGFSVENLTRSGVSFLSEFPGDGASRIYNLMGGIHLRATSDVLFEPSIYLKSSDLIMFQGELNLKLMFNDKIWIGASYRTLNTISFLTGVKINNFFIGYAYDYGFYSLQKNSYGTHELMLALKLGDNTKRYRWLERY